VGILEAWATLIRRYTNYLLPRSHAFHTLREMRLHREILKYMTAVSSQGFSLRR